MGMGWEEALPFFLGLKLCGLSWKASKICLRGGGWGIILKDIIVSFWLWNGKHWNQTQRVRIKRCLAML